VNVLVKRGADINLLDEHQDSALHWAAYQGMLSTVGLLHHLGLSASEVYSARASYLITVNIPMATIMMVVMIRMTCRAGLTAR
jgi:ankyrin repeat protein